MNEKIIKEFLQEMADQDNRAIASPYFYVIRTQVKDLYPDTDGADEIKYYSSDYPEETFDSVDDFKESLLSEGYPPEEIDEAAQNLQTFGIKYSWKEEGMFLTESDAMEHLKTNYYHYSDNAHTCVKHAFRAPKLKSFLTALMEHFEIKPSQKVDYGS